MNCDEFRQLAQAIARDEPLDAATLEGALGHADGCPSCDSLLEEAEALTSELRALAAHYVAESAPRRIEAHLAAVVERRREPGAGRSRSWWRPSAAGIGTASRIVLALRRRSAAIIGVAAAVILVLALTGWPAAIWHPTWHPAWLAGVGQTSPAQQVFRASSDRRPGSQVATSDEDQSTDSFVPLSGTYDLASLNDDPIVRVVLSDNDLESLGLPVSDSGDEQVVADLIIGTDGTPQAIRLVSW